MGRMERFNALGRGMQLMLVGGVLFLIDLFLPWQKYNGPFADAIEAAGGDISRTAFHGFGGWLLTLLTLVLLAWIVARMAAVEIPIPVSAAMTAAVLAFLIFAIAVLKSLVDDYSGWASWVGVILALVIAVGAWMQIQESGGLENLKSEASSMMPASSPASSGPAPAPAQPVSEPTVASEPHASEDAAEPAEAAASPASEATPEAQAPGREASAEPVSEATPAEPASEPEGDEERRA
jgi:hypothetical protein